MNLPAPASILLVTVTALLFFTKTVILNLFSEATWEKVLPILKEEHMS